MNGYAERMNCPLCNSSDSVQLGSRNVEHAHRDFYRCGYCDCIHVPESQHPPKEEEIRRYATHNNQYGNPAYRTYLEKILEGATEWMGSLNDYRVLDYGGGEEEVLARMLREKAIEAECWDPIYGYDKLDSTPYDRIICCEAAEHFANPKNEFQRMKKILRPGGLIYVVTRLSDTIDQPLQWWYINDSTHLVFYSCRSWEYIADSFGFTLLRCDSESRILLQG